MSEFNFGSAKDLKPGRYVIIDDIPCRVVSMDTSKPGKHGAAKMRIVAIGIFDGQKKNLLTSSDGDVHIPVINKFNAQVISLSGDTVQLMNKDTFEMFEAYVPEDLKADVIEGRDVEVMESMGRKAIVRVFKAGD
ncbi:MAG: translation initiation factor IF-5A [Candidatus Micrarchaeota archaeon]|jgi:translation initiation factor 5A|nr:translation initiation factor IF-5A [Candidatus Micrarchaeota archaeon]